MSWAQQIVGDYASNFFTDYNSKVGYGYVNVESRRRFGFNDSIGTTERTVWAGADGGGGVITATNMNYLSEALCRGGSASEQHRATGGFQQWNDRCQRSHVSLAYTDHNLGGQTMPCGGKKKGGKKK